ncbi:SDR family NAD(P)-dependent oxidoreductase [Enterococcus hermanniensis]|uniref:Carbonyl reductase n=1 Tax=Enterococcus hermanniensis TaxID=249189 RepID=A0A1L8TS94_9ENTE|nr:SDR family NAD(P)-dependent oxidoreductase [Enterococcus hermanniensis]OJG47048.1 hypothetical protein RV04_GL000295 [Enterococcus hermanniensis]
MTNKVLITGANKGIGFESARQLGHKGWYILLGARNEERGLAAVQQLKNEGIANVEWVQIDLNDLASITNAAAYIRENHSDLNALINNAGISGDMHKRPLDFTLDELKAVTEVNVYGNFSMIKAFTPILSKNQGKILHVTLPGIGAGSFRPFAYMASKASLNSMIRNFGYDFKKNQISVDIFGVMPGGIQTDLNDHMTGWMMRTLPEGTKSIVDVLTDGKSHQGKILSRSGMAGSLTKHLLKQVNIFSKNK